jgi:hypothetical protein
MAVIKSKSGVVDAGLWDVSEDYNLVGFKTIQSSTRFENVTRAVN